MNLANFSQQCKEDSAEGCKKKVKQLRNSSKPEETFIVYVKATIITSSYYNVRLSTKRKKPQTTKYMIKCYNY